ncbi:MAG: hypothetical protein ABIP19_13430, partial [Dermatophilaceae bacterium]
RIPSVHQAADAPTLDGQPHARFGCFAGLPSKKIKSAGLRPTLGGLPGSGHAASGRSLRRSPTTSEILDHCRLQK